MEAKIKAVGDVTVVTLVGKLEIEKSSGFKKACIEAFQGKKVVFSFEQLQFVGSTGIQSYFSILNDLNTSSAEPVKLANVKPDFMRVLAYSSLQGLEVHEDVPKALASFQPAVDSLP